MTYISSLFIISIRSNQDHGKTLCNILFVVISNNPFFTSYRVQWVYFCRMVVFTSTSIYCTFSTYSISIKLEIRALWVFLSADAQLLGTILAGARMPLSMCFQSLLRLNEHCSSFIIVLVLIYKFFASILAFISYKC